MLVSGYNNIILLPNCTMLYYVFSGPLSLRAYVPEIKFNNNNGIKKSQCNGRYSCNLQYHESVHQKEQLATRTNMIP